MSVGATPSLNFIGDTVGDTPPHSMSEMRGVRFASGNSPTTGAISLSDFRNQVLTRAAVEEVKLTAPDPRTGDNFGAAAESVSISGDGSYVIVGASGLNTAYIFKRTNSSWAEQAALTPSGGAVSISGDGSYAILAVLYEDLGGATGAGAAYIFKRTNSSWAQQAKITVSDPQDRDNFGRSVSISQDGSYAAVVASGRGYVYIFKRTNSSWAQQQKISASGCWSVSISEDGSYAAVGASGANAAYIFKRTNSSWAEQATLTASDGETGDEFGTSASISVDGSYVIVGAYGDVANGLYAGAAYIFKRTNSSWDEQAKLIPPVRRGFDLFGYSASISGDGSYAVVGSVGEELDGVRSAGAAYIFKRTNSSWAEYKKFQASDKEYFDLLGGAVSITGDATRIMVAGGSYRVSGFAYILHNSYYI